MTILELWETRRISVKSSCLEDNFLQTVIGIYLDEGIEKEKEEKKETS